MATSQNLDRLIEKTQISDDVPFALFLDAGVNGGSWAAEHPACASWPKLLELLSGVNKPVGDHQVR